MNAGRELGRRKLHAGGLIREHTRRREDGLVRGESLFVMEYFTSQFRSIGIKLFAPYIRMNNPERFNATHWRYVIWDVLHDRY